MKRIGFTYDLKSDYLKAGFSLEDAAEFDSQETIDEIAKALINLGYWVDLIGNAKALLNKLHSGQRWDIVFNICEGVHGIGREAQVPAILDLYNIPYVFSDVLVMSLTLHKGKTKQIIRDLGIPTAPFFVVESEDDIEHIDLDFPLFVKPVAEGTGKGISSNSKVADIHKLGEVCRRQLMEFQQPVIVETFLPGREFTVGMMGAGKTTRTIGMIEVVYNENEKSGIYSYENKARYEEFIRYAEPEPDLYNLCADVAIRAWKGLGCRDAGRIDLRLDAHGVPNFMEVNPLAGLNPIHSDLPILSLKAGINFQQLIGMIMDEALQRLAKN